MIAGAIVLGMVGVFLVIYGNRNLMRTTGMSRSVEEHTCIQIEPDDLPTYEEIDNFPVIM